MPHQHIQSASLVQTTPPAASQDPNNADFNALHRKWKVAQAAAGKAEAKLYSKMFAPRPSAARPQAAEAAPAAEVAPAPEPIAAV